MNKEKLTMIELFSGIGAQVRGVKNTNLWDCTVVNTSEIDKDAMLSYAIIHCGLTPELVESYKEYPSNEEMAKYLTERRIGFDFKKNTLCNWSKSKDIRKYYLACILSKNLGDISYIKRLMYADFWTYSFPRQDVSVAGKQEGITKSKTRSGLLYEVERLLETAVNEGSQPKYLLLENVKNLVGRKFRVQFDEWIARLDDLGYNTYWQVVNGKDCGVPQNRERCFAISIRKDIDCFRFCFANAFDNGLRLRDLLDTNIDDNFYLSEKIQKRFVLTDSTFTRNVIGTTKGVECTRHGERDLVYNQNTIIGALTATDYKQPKQIIANQLECQQNGSCNYHIRKLMPIECMRLMGFDDNDFHKLKRMELSDTSIYKQTGNSIITNCITLIMEHLYKAQVDDTYICTDENFT